MSDFEELQIELREFAVARDWLQFHNPKNLAMAIASEAGELLAEFRWLTADESTPERLSPERQSAIRLEMADVLIFLIRMSDVLKVDLPTTVREKIKMNIERFPVAGSSDNK